MTEQNKIKELVALLYKRERLTPGQLQELDAWMRSLGSSVEFSRWLTENWKQAEDIPVDISFAEVREQLNRHLRKSRTFRREIFFSRIQRIAAVLFIPLFVASVWLVYQRVSVDSSQWVSLKTGKGQRTHVYLPDGSEVWLNVDSRLKYSTDFNANNRDLKLEGEGYFKVAHNAQLPFVVEAKDFFVKALGTEFNVYAYPDERGASAYLHEGSVELNFLSASAGRRGVVLTPGQKVVLDDTDGNAVKISRARADHELGWKSGQLIFMNEKMPQVFNKIERWYNVEIEYDAHSFADETLYLNLDEGESLEKLLTIIDNVIGIRINRNGNTILIEKK